MSPKRSFYAKPLHLSLPEALYEKSRCIADREYTSLHEFARRAILAQVKAYEAENGEIEPDAGKLARPVLRRRGGGNPSLLFDRGILVIPPMR